MPRPRTEAAPSDAPRRKTEPQLRSRRCPAEYYPSGLSGVGDLQRIKKGGAVLIPMRRSLREAFHHPRSRRSQYSWSSALADSCSCARAAAARPDSNPRGLEGEGNAPADANPSSGELVAAGGRNDWPENTAACDALCDKPASGGSCGALVDSKPPPLHRSPLEDANRPCPRRAASRARPLGRSPGGGIAVPNPSIPGRVPKDGPICAAVAKPPSAPSSRGAHRCARRPRGGLGGTSSPAARSATSASAAS